MSSPTLSSKTVFACVLTALAGCSGPVHTGGEMERAGHVAATCAEQGGKARIVSSSFRRTALSVDCFLTKGVEVEK